jgi:hypothetical protein
MQRTINFAEIIMALVPALIVLHNKNSPHPLAGQGGLIEEYGIGGGSVVF